MKPIVAQAFDHRSKDETNRKTCLSCRLKGSDDTQEGFAVFELEKH